MHTRESDPGRGARLVTAAIGGFKEVALLVIIAALVSAVLTLAEERARARTLEDCATMGAYLVGGAARLAFVVAHPECASVIDPAREG